MQPTRFRPLVDTAGPFASVVVDDSHNTADAEKQFELRWRAVAEELGAQGADDALIEAVHGGLSAGAQPVGRGGRAVVATRDGAQLVERLIRSPDIPTTRVSALPYLVPVIIHGIDDPPYLTVVVDHAGVDVTSHRNGRSESITAEGDAYPVHKASGSEDAGYGDTQRTAEGARLKNIQEAAAVVTTTFDDVGPELVFVVGEVRSRADLVANLPQRVAECVVEVNAGARGSIDEEALRHDIDTRLQLRRVDTIDEAAQRFQAELHRESGLATEGLAGVCAALREGAVDTLMIGDIGAATVLVGDSPTLLAPTPEVLSELGAGGSATTVRADEALPLAAVAVDANLVALDERVAPRDGVAALLRYAPRTSA
ncbi:hypothetical protein CRI77_21215 [Mycolicibacterium duvalii]|uniref:Uncharacterized protein n=1 Tax=Mycolicibacterium duvalii TaxID=39688 RepID=A0A7I7JXB5_9MYCO|nr:hypothetical protein [Mycolicibacterium duvalii]MCV7370316.1 hypothetical protein [Mycolicibacterium duvalii]PEG37285.1 hypothetical protein CRI77_21215 [Mycolicibacterium duvalii]BBX16506.1 hypothetical protein MDUV_13660 [Mycolicibacterium duvalii]